MYAIKWICIYCGFKATKEDVWLKDSSSDLNVGDSIINDLVEILCDKMGEVVLAKNLRHTSTQIM